MAPRSGFELRGTKAMQRKLEQIKKRAVSAVERALLFEAELIVARSKKEFVPVHLGNLRSSGHVEYPARRRGDDLIVTMAFGGTAAPYAVAVHEHPSEASPRSWQGKSIEEIESTRRPHRPWTVGQTGRGPKYLERPMNQAVDGMARRIAKQVEGAMR